jgi:uncharacterized phage infection (PIP) family protein YhgE
LVGSVSVVKTGVSIARDSYKQAQQKQDHVNKLNNTLNSLVNNKNQLEGELADIQINNKPDINNVSEKISMIQGQINKIRQELK